MFNLIIFCLTITLLALSLSSVKCEASFDYAVLTINDTRTFTPFDFTVAFRPTKEIFADHYVVVRLPRFSQMLKDNFTTGNISLGNVILSPSYDFEAVWIEGKNHPDYDTHPYVTSELEIRRKRNESFPQSETQFITIHKENGIGAVCGFPSFEIFNSSPKLVDPFPPFHIFTRTIRINQTNNFTIDEFNNTINDPTFNNYTARPNDTFNFQTWTGVGNGCSLLSNCYNNGACDYCYEKCECFEGFGSKRDLVAVGRDLLPDCSTRVCPAGRAIGDFPITANKAHSMAECSNRGLCNRKTGICNCFFPFAGPACDKLTCPNECSGHGQCISMNDINRIRRVQNPDQVTFEYGSGDGLETVAWDYDSMFGCYCDSSWEVGYGAGETQLAEWFGPDCSLKRCPSGDDPFTTQDETDCYLKSQYPGLDAEVGHLDNLCHIECSNRGLCNHQTGKCTCFKGSWGQSCENIANAGSRSWNISNDNISVVVQGN